MTVKKLKLWRWLQTPAAAALFATMAAAQSPPPLVVQSVPVGQRPMGITAVYWDIIVGGFAHEEIAAVVANSADNSVSVLHFGLASPPLPPGSPLVLASSELITGIPSPFAVPCDSVVTSPSDNSITFIDSFKATLRETVKVGKQPYSAVCAGETTVYVSNYGDSSISVVNVPTYTVTRTIPNVPGSRSMNGIGFGPGGLWVAGTDANVVTVVNPDSGAVVASIPVHAPTFIGPGPGSSRLVVGSTDDNRILFFDTTQVTITATVSGIPTPQAVFGNLVTTGPGNSVVLASENGSFSPYVAGVPGAAGISTTTLINKPLTLVTSPDTNRVFSIQPAPSTPNQFGASNGASFGTAATAPGSLASLFATTGASQNFNAAAVPLPKTLGGVTLSLGGSLSFDATVGWKYSSTGAVQAPLLFVGPNQINFQIPPGIAPGSAVGAQLTKPDGTTLLTTLNITATAPGIFTVLQNGQGQAAALNQDNSQNFGTNPAKLGSVIQIYATGGGETTPSLGPGEAAAASGNPLVLTKAQPTVTIGGQTATVQFSGMAPGYVGLWQINTQIPQTVTPGNAVPLVVSAGGVSSNTVTIAVQ